jgi:hypothetical protein
MSEVDMFGMKTIALFIAALAFAHAPAAGDNWY